MSRNPSGGSDRRNEDNPETSNSLIRQKNEEIIEKLKELVDQQSQQVDSQESEIDALKKRIAELEKEMEQLKGDRNVLIIGEVCRKFQANLYQYVFQNKCFSPYYNYKMTKLEEDIEDIQSAREKAKARKLWEQLKQKEHPEKFQKLVKQLQKLRNTTANPEIAHLDVKDVLKAAEEVNEQEGFEFLRYAGFNFEDVKELIEMWARIDGYIKDSKK